jgi:hypothetical protein
VKKNIFITLVTFILLFSLVLSACSKPSQVPVPTATNWVPAFEEAQASDDIIITPGGPTYAGNISSANTTKPLTPVSMVQATLSQNATFAHITYRAVIESQKPATRNNIITVFLTGKSIDLSQPANAVQGLSLYTLDLPRGVTITEGMQLPGSLSTSSVLVLNITEDAKAGKHEFEIGLVINGIDFGTLPCTLTVTD